MGSQASKQKAIDDVTAAVNVIDGAIVKAEKAFKEASREIEAFVGRVSRPVPPKERRKAHRMREDNLARVEALELMKDELEDRAAQRAGANLSDGDWIELVGFVPSGKTETAVAVESALEGAVEVEDNGKVIFRVLVGAPMTGQSMAEITSALSGGSIYTCYLRTISQTSVSDVQRKDAWVKGADRGDHVTRYWRPFELGDSVRGYQITRGRLESLEENLRTTARGYVVGWYVALVPRGGRAGKDWLAMREGAENCVVRALREEMESKRALRPIEKAALEGLEKRVARGGATEAHLAGMCSKLKRQIQIRDLEDAILWRPMKNGKPLYDYKDKRRTMVLYRTNGHGYHAKNAKMPFPEKLKVVHEGSPKVTSEREYEQHENRRLANLIKEEGIIRAYQLGSSIVAAETKTLYRPLSVDMDICSQDGLPGTSSDYNLKEDGSDHVNLYPGGSLSYAFKVWRQKARIDSLPRNQGIRRDWRLSNFEAIPWARSGASLEGATCYDMRAAYLACGTHHAAGPAHEWAKVHGFPEGKVHLRAAAEEISQIRHLAGCVRFLSLELAPECHPALVSQIAAHLSCHGPWFPIPMAVYLLDKGLITSHRLEQVIYSAGKIPGIEWPSRDRAVRFIGSCKYAEKMSVHWTRDASEAEYYAAKYKAFTEEIEGVWRISYASPSGPKNDHSYIRSYVLGYMFIGMCEAIQSLPPEAVIACKTDSITLASGYDFPGAYPAGHQKWMIPYGAFRQVKVPVPVSGLVAELQTSFPSDPEAPIATVPSDQIAVNQLTFMSGQGGSGKTYRACRAFPGRRVVLLGKDNDHLEQTLRTNETNPEGYPAYTYHEYFKLGLSDPVTWTSDKMGMRRPEVVIWDEIGCVPSEFVRSTLGWLRRVGAQVVLCGDPMGQTPPHGDKDNGKRMMAMLSDLRATEVAMTTDWRASSCQVLQDLKLRAWQKSEEEQLSCLREIPAIPLPEYLDGWKPSDIIAVVGKPTGKALDSLLERVRARDFPNEPIPYRFAPSKDRRELYRKRGGRLPVVLTPDGTRRRVCIGAIIEGPPGSAPPSEDWVRAYWRTVRSLQSQTVKAPSRLVIIDELFGSAWQTEKQPNSCYTVLSRPQMFSQLVRVIPGQPGARTNRASIDDVYGS